VSILQFLPRHDLLIVWLLLLRKASASTQAVDERKELEARKRELKKLTAALNTAEENLAATESQQSKLQDEVSIVQERQSSVGCEFKVLDVVLTLPRQLEEQAEEAGRRLREKRTELEHIQRDTSRIRFVDIFLIGCFCSSLSPQPS
jgi:biopolymer transport protein ExbB/TolQ